MRVRNSLIIALLLAILVTFTGLPQVAPGVPWAEKEIKLTGILRSAGRFKSIYQVEWVIEIENIISGPQQLCPNYPQSSQPGIFVEIASNSPAYVDPKINEGDRVEAYGSFVDKSPSEGCGPLFLTIAKKEHYIKEITPKEKYEVLKTYEIIDPYPKRDRYGDETFLTVFREIPNLSNPRHQILYIEVSAATTEDEGGNLSNPVKYGEMSFAIDEDVAVLFPNIKVYIPAEKNHLIANEVEPLPYYNPDKYVPMPNISDSSLIADTLKFIVGPLPVLGGMIAGSDWISIVRRELLEPTIVVPKNSSQHPKTMRFSENEMDIIPVGWIPEKELFGLTEKGYESIVVKFPIVFPKKAEMPEYKVYIHGNYKVEMPWWSDPTGAVIEYNEVLNLIPPVM